jgi:hypothetical protein
MELSSINKVWLFINISKLPLHLVFAEHFLESLDRKGEVFDDDRLFSEAVAAAVVVVDVVVFAVVVVPF